MNAVARHSLRLALVLGLLPFLACKCRDKPPRSTDVCAGVQLNQADHPGSCEDSSECGDHHACISVDEKPGVSCCLYSVRKCNSEADCCPGQTCREKRCRSAVLECSDDTQCGTDGDRFCEPFSDAYSTANVCRFHACGALGECPAGQACFQGECMATLPCGGSCPPGKACVPTSDRCQEFACPASCAPGFIATFKDPRNLWDTCNLPEVACECAELPSLHSGDLGRHSALAVDALKNEILVSEYDGEFGDLVLARFDATGKLLSRQYLDGVPATGQVAYGPSGPRGGIVDPGEDVGRYTDIIAHDNYAFISYYDVTHGDLKLGARNLDGSWSTFTVDGAGAEVGLYSSLDIDSDDHVGITYFQRGGSSTFDVTQCPLPAPKGKREYVTALKFARANSVNPRAGDFTITTLACQDRPAPPCQGCAGVCATPPGGNPSCLTVATGCPACDSSEVCVEANGQPTCAPRYVEPNVAEIVDGVGLFPSATFKGREGFVVYMRRVDGDGDLYGVKVSSSGARNPPILLDATGDTGYFPDVKVHPTSGQLAISYQDFSSHSLKFFLTANFASGLKPEVIDPGSGPPGSGQAAWVGTDSSLAFGPTGALYAAYQDATRGDLMLASRNPTWRVVTGLRTDGAVGFFADAAFLGKTLFVSHAKLHTALVAQAPKVNNVLMLDQYTPP